MDVHIALLFCISISISIPTLLHLLRTLANLQLHLETVLLPQDKRILLRPILTLVTQLPIEVPEHASQDRAHLIVRETAFTVSTCLAFWKNSAQNVTYFRPIQLRGPYEKG